MVGLGPPAYPSVVATVTCIVTGLIRVISHPRKRSQTSRQHHCFNRSSHLLPQGGQPQSQAGTWPRIWDPRLDREYQTTAPKQRAHS